MNQESNKPVVKYFVPDFIKALPPTVGYSTRVVPVDHYNEYLNGEVCTTSTVVSVGQDGTFTTRNTVYVLDQQQQSEV